MRETAMSFINLRQELQSRGARFWETDLLPLLVLTRRGRSTGKKQYW